MKAMILEQLTDLSAHASPLVLRDVETPEPEPRQVRIEISACGVCHTELDEIEGRTPPPSLPMILGHQVVGRIDRVGLGVDPSLLHRRVGVGWIFDSCGKCAWCLEGRDNLCPDFQATGRDAPGGFAQFMVVPASSAFPVPQRFSDSQAAPLLCAGAIGYRSLNLTGLKDGQALGLTGFGASGHLVLKMAATRYPNSPVYVFARSEKERRFALDLGAKWAGEARESSPRLCQAIIDTTPVWTPVVEALKNLSPGGRLVINAIRKEEHDKNALQWLKYPDHIWMEKEIKSVANVARSDIQGFLRLADKMAIAPDVTEYALHEANRALLELKKGGNRGAKVLKIT